MSVAAATKMAVFEVFPNFAGKIGTKMEIKEEKITYTKITAVIPGKYSGEIKRAFTSF